MSTSDKNHTYLFHNHIWEPDLLEVGHRYDFFFQGICETTEPQISILQAHISYNNSIKIVSPPLDRKIHEEDVPIPIVEDTPDNEKYNLARAIQLSNLFYLRYRSRFYCIFNGRA